MAVVRAVSKGHVEASTESAVNLCQAFRARLDRDPPEATGRVRHGGCQTRADLGQAHCGNGATVAIAIQVIEL